jgi:hypothetical protein
VRMAPHFFLTFCWTWKVENKIPKLFSTRCKIIQHML